MSAAKCLVSLMVVLVAAVCVAHAQERIKMCGRELIRLAVSSCGNSRLRRSILDVDVDQHQYTAHCEYCQTSGVVTPVSHISDYYLISYRINTIFRSCSLFDDDLISSLWGFTRNLSTKLHISRV